MQRFIYFVIIFCFISPCLCTRLKVGTQNNAYNVMDYGASGDGKTDDSQAFLSAWSNACKAGGDSTLIIPAEKSFMATNITFSGPCNAKIHIQFDGKIVAPSKEAWKSGEYLINIDHLNGITIDGNGQGGADGDGSTWWECQDCNRPGIFHFHACDDLKVSNIMVTNSPKNHISINKCNGATFSQISIDSPETSPNTDGIDISFSNNILVEDSNIKSGDDCIAINGDSTFINATGVTCGPGHGISVGSLGKVRPNDKVSNVYVQNCTFIGTSNGARIKTKMGGSGYAKFITFEQIILENVKYPIIIDQKYQNLELDTDVVVSDVTFQGFTGTGSADIAIKLDCSSSGCHNILLNENNIMSTSGKNLSVVCNNAYGTATNTIPSVTCLQKE